MASVEDEKKGKSGLLKPLVPRRRCGDRACRGAPAGCERSGRETSPVAEPPADAPTPPPLAAAPPPAPKQSWLQRLRLGLSRSSTTIARGVTDIFTKRKLDAASLDDLEDVLIQADLGLAAATRIREAVGRGRYERGINPDEVKQILADEVERALESGRAPAGDRSHEAPVRDPRHRRQRLRQDDDHRQARRQVQGRRQGGAARGGRHLPRRRGRAIAHLGAAHVVRARRARSGRRRGRASPSRR